MFQNVFENQFTRLDAKSGITIGDLGISTRGVNGIDIYTTLTKPIKNPEMPVTAQTILDIFDKAIEAGEELPVLVQSDFTQLVIEAALIPLSDFDIQELAEYQRYHGRGFGVSGALVLPTIYEGA